MIWVAILLGFVLGVAINTAANSLPFARKIQKPHCQACGAPRDWIAWSGLSAWLSARRQCEYCGTSLRVREIVVEIVMVLGATTLLWVTPDPLRALIDLFAVSIFMLIMIIDLEHRLILHVVSIPAALYFALVGSLDPSLGPSRTIVGGLIGFVFFFLLYVLGALFARWMGRRRGEDIEEVAFGFGDVMLALVIGLAVGFPGVIGALLRGILFAGVFSFVYMLVMAIIKRYEAFTPIPYGPFLILGALWVYFRGDPGMETLLGY